MVFSVNKAHQECRIFYTHTLISNISGKKGLSQSLSNDQCQTDFEHQIKESLNYKGRTLLIYL